MRRVELRGDPETRAVEYGWSQAIGREGLEAFVSRLLAAGEIETPEEFAEEMERARLTDQIDRTYEDGLFRSGRSERVWRMRHSGDVFEEVRWELEEHGDTP